MLANWITLFRLPVLLAVVGALYTQSQAVRLLGVAALLLGLALDTVDGIIARRRQESTLLGSVLDIATDRVYEIVLWICFADLGLVPMLIPIVVVVRSSLIDGFRSVGAREGVAPFAQLRSRLGRFLVASSWMRSAYGISKVIAFGGLAVVNGLGVSSVAPVYVVAQVAVYLCVTLCVVRGVPVVAEGMRQPGIATAR